MDALIQQKNFTNISVVQRDLALKGERVSILKNRFNDAFAILQLEKAMFNGRTLNVAVTGTNMCKATTVYHCIIITTVYFC